MKVSIITPVYNAEKYIKKTIESVKNQTYPDYEWIIIDDGSTDSSGTILDKAASEDERIQVIHQNNKGTSAARNKGLDLCDSKYVIFLDAFDIMKKEFVGSSRMLIHNWLFTVMKKGSTSMLIRL